MGALVVIAGLAAGALVAPALAQAASPPPNPTNGQISSAANQKAALASQVGPLGAQVVAMQTQLQQLQAAQELAEQKYVFALQKYQDAQTSAGGRPDRHHRGACSRRPGT